MTLCGWQYAKIQELTLKARTFDSFGFSADGILIFICIYLFIYLFSFIHFVIPTAEFRWRKSAAQNNDNEWIKKLNIFWAPYFNWEKYASPPVNKRIWLLKFWKVKTSSVQFSPLSERRLGRRGDMRDVSAVILFQSFLQEALVSSYGMSSNGCPLFDVVHPAFPLPTTASFHQWSSSNLFCRRLLWEVLAWAGISTRWCCPSRTSSADQVVAHPPRCPEGRFGRGCCGVWHAQTMPVSVSWQLLEEGWANRSNWRTERKKVSQPENRYPILGVKTAIPASPLIFFSLRSFVEGTDWKPSQFCT